MAAGSESADGADAEPTSRTAALAGGVGAAVGAAVGVLGPDPWTVGLVLAVVLGVVAAVAAFAVLERLQ